MGIISQSWCHKMEYINLGFTKILKKMKKIFMIAVAMFGFAAMADAASNVTASEWGINALSTTSVDYVGGFTSVNMNGDPKNPVEDKVTSVISDGETISSLVSESFQVGKMPGTIQIKASNLTIDAASGVFASSCTVELTILGSTSYYTGTIAGSILNGKLTYTVKCPAKWLGISFDTEVTFEGEA